MHPVSPEHGENVTIVARTNAVGNAVPPMLLFKGKRGKKREFLVFTPPNTDCELTNKGSMTTIIFIKWLQHFAKYKQLENA